MRYYVISPHSFCDKHNSYRHCDRVAKFYAEAIAKRLKEQGHEVELQLSDQLRFGNCKNPDSKDLFRCDYNRDTTLNLPWRKEFEAKIVEFNPHFIFEVHSYPGEMTEYFNLWKNFKLQCIKSSHNSPFIAQIVDGLGDVKNHVGIASPDFEPSITHQIGDRYPHTLFEFNEKFTDAVLAKKVADVVSKMFSDKKEVYGGNITEKCNCQKLYVFIALLILMLLILIILFVWCYISKPNSFWPSQ